MTSQPSTDIDGAEFRRVLGHFSTGVTVVTADGDSGPTGVAIGSFTSISLDPPLVGFFLGGQSSSGTVIQSTGSFCVNILAADQLALCGTMASRSDNKFDGVDWKPAATTGSPILPGIVAHIDCSLHQVIAVGDHNLIVGRVVALDTAEATEPMVFYSGSYGTFSQP